MDSLLGSFSGLDEGEQAGKTSMSNVEERDCYSLFVSDKTDKTVRNIKQAFCSQSKRIGPSQDNGLSVLDVKPTAQKDRNDALAERRKKREERARKGGRRRNPNFGASKAKDNS